MKSALMVRRKRSTVLVSVRTVQEAVERARALGAGLGRDRNPRQEELKRVADHLESVLGKTPQQMRADGASSVEDYFDDARLPEQAQTIKREIDMIARWHREKKAADGGAAFTTDRDEKGEPKAPEKLEVPRVAAKKTAEVPPPPPPEAPPAPAATTESSGASAPIPADGTFDINTLSSEALAKSIKALTSIKEFETDKSAQALIEEMANVLKQRPAEQEPPKPAKPAAMPAPAPQQALPVAASRKRADDDPARAPVSLGGLDIAASVEEKTADDYRLHDYKLDDEGIRPTGKLPTMDEQEDRMRVEPEPGPEPQPQYASAKQAVSPPGWGGTVEHMKEHKDIDNPFALGWYMKNKGDTPRYKDSSSEDSVATRLAALEHWRRRQAEMHAELAARYASGSMGGAWTSDFGEKGKVTEDGGRTPEVAEAHSEVDEGPAKLGRPATTAPIKLAAGEMTTKAAVKKAEELGRRLKEMYLDSKALTAVNDQRAVREAVEGIFRAADAFDEAVKVLSKQAQQEQSEADAADIKARNKKSSAASYGLALAASAE